MKIEGKRFENEPRRSDQKNAMEFMQWRVSSKIENHIGMKDNES